ncbi:hypothetical protein Nmel_016980, partial [Mimus melanotis]
GALLGAAAWEPPRAGRSSAEGSAGAVNEQAGLGSVCVCACSVFTDVLALEIRLDGGTHHSSPSPKPSLSPEWILTLPAGQSFLPGHCDSSPAQQHIPVKLLIFQVLPHYLQSGIHVPHCNTLQKLNGCWHSQSLQSLTSRRMYKKLHSS